MKKFLRIAAAFTLIPLVCIVFFTLVWYGLTYAWNITDASGQGVFVYSFFSVLLSFMVEFAYFDVYIDSKN